jgi:molybdenum-dependent DNA-binding transcriptional regulator ModE
VLPPSPPGFKRTLQILTSTLVHAERASPGNAKAVLLDEARDLLARLLEMHAAITTTGDGQFQKHQAWFEQTVARARVVLDAAR